MAAVGSEATEMERRDQRRENQEENLQDMVMNYLDSEGGTQERERAVSGVPGFGEWLTGCTQLC